MWKLFLVLRPDQSWWAGSLQLGCAAAQLASKQFPLSCALLRPLAPSGPDKPLSGRLFLQSRCGFQCSLLDKFDLLFSRVTFMSMLLVSKPFDR